MLFDDVVLNGIDHLLRTIICARPQPVTRRNIRSEKYRTDAALPQPRQIRMGHRRLEARCR